MLRARLKPCGVTRWKAGRWRDVAHTRVTCRAVDCHGGGVPMGARILIYADEPFYWYETSFDFAHNCEEREVEDGGS